MFRSSSPQYFREKKLVKELLPKVSRTFALNIRVLDEDDYFIIGCAYLICRYLDTIEDSPSLSHQAKSSLFNKIERNFTQTPDEKWPAFFKKLSEEKGLSKISDQHYENLLWQRFHLIVRLFNSFAKKHRDILLKPILKMLQGMRFFIVKHSKNKHKNIYDEKEMEEYCYYVAGTVSELLTEFFKLKIKSTLVQKKLDDHKIDFGQGLQMINILKDLFSDRKRNWLYIPEKNILQNKLSVQEFFNFKVENKAKILGIYRDLVEKANLKLENALTYTLSIPKYLPKYRLFCLIPLMLAVKTSFLLKKQDNFNKFSHKISKFEVFIVIIATKIVVHSNSLIKKYFYHYR